MDVLVRNRIRIRRTLSNIVLDCVRVQHEWALLCELNGRDRLPCTRLPLLSICSSTRGGATVTIVS